MAKIDNSVLFSGCTAIVMPQKPTQTGVTFDFVRTGRTGTKWGERNDADGFISNSLVRSNGVVVIFIFSDQEFQVALAKHNELADAFILDRLNESFGKRIQIWRSEGQLLHFDAFTFKNFIKFGGELGIAILDQVGRFLASVSQIHHKVPGLLFDPRPIWIAAHPGDLNPSRANVDEEKDVVGHFAESSPDILGEEIACPKRVDVPLDKLVPVTLGAVWARMKAVRNQDFLDGVCCHFDAELFEFALDASIAPGIFLRQPEDQFCQIGRNRRATERRGRMLLRGRPSSFIAHPPQEGFVMHDAQDFLDRVSERRTQANQQRSFCRRGLNLFGQSGMENLVLGFKESDLAQQNGLRHLNEKNEDRILTGSGHRKMRRRWSNRRISDTKISSTKKIDFQRRKHSGTTFLHPAKKRFDLGVENWPLQTGRKMNFQGTKKLKSSTLEDWHPLKMVRTGFSFASY